MSERDEKKYQPRRFRDSSSEKAPVSKPVDSAEEITSENISAEPAGATQSEQTDVSFDYVMPEDTYRKHRKKSKHKHKSGSHISTRVVETIEIDEDAAEDYVFNNESQHSSHRHHHHHHHRPRMKRWKKVLLAILCILLALIVAAVGTFFVLREMGRRSMHDYENVSIVIPTEDESGNEIIPVDKYGRVITYNGMSYAFNDDIISLTLIGADDGTNNGENLRMSDAIYIAAIDAKGGSVKILSVSRDTMADVDVYSSEGEYIDTENMQISYAYSFENENVSGGKNTNAALSHIFFGLPMNNFFAINMDALTTLNDAIGGVTLTSSMTFDSPEDGHTIYEGETVTLHGQEAERYVRYRDHSNVEESNNDRMKRQQEYIRAFLSSIVPAAKADLSVITDLYGAITENSESSLDLPKITYIASTALSKLNSASDIEYVSLSGEMSVGEHAEMHVTDEEALKTMLDIFYKPLAKVPDMTTD